MKAKNIALRVIAAVGILLVIALELRDYWENGSLSSLPKAFLTLASLISLFAATFISRLDSKRKVNMEADFEKAAVYFQEEPRAKRLFHRGFRGWYANDYSLACQYLEKAAKAAENPRAKARAYFYIGRCALEEEKYPRAIEYLEKAVELDRSFGDAASNLVTAYFSAGQREKAKAVCETGLMYSPQNAPMYTKLGKYYFDAGEYEEAFPLFCQAEQLAPANPALVMNVAVAYASLGNAGAAGERFNRAKLLGYKDCDQALRMINTLLANSRANAADKTK